ncbi:MAG TPA: diacylglycerol kinase family protein [Flavobacterium sp.]|jgi:diacylglycerol kinase (ATP)|nr:diacylglycerol kinase family protein [Flavobacterium sp.]HPJ10565.1 diacylglycerol kinase family protein [Flavobacterium sp.]
MEKNVLFVVNPVSGDLDKTQLIEAVGFFATHQRCHFELYETTGKDDLAAIKALYKKHQPERIIVAGGDGTIKMVAEAVEPYDVILGILPAGSANGLSVDLNLPSALEENLEVAFSNNFMDIDMICINGKKSLHLSDLGLNADLVKNYENSDTRGMWGYALQAFTTLKDLDAPFEVMVTANSETYQSIARMVVIANSQKYGTGVTINPNGKMDDGKFEIVILKNLDLMIFAQIITGNIPIDSENVEIISTHSATVTTNVPVSFQIDGEYCGPQTSLDIKILEKRLKVAVP